MLNPAKPKAGETLVGGNERNTLDHLDVVRGSRYARVSRPRTRVRTKVSS